MKPVFVDANLFLRFFTRDDETHHRKAVSFFKRVSAGQIRVLTGPPVLFEVAWTLRSAYHQPSEKVLEVLGAILSLPGLKMTDTHLVSQALDLARNSGIEFADAYIAASAAEAGAVVGTFNRRHFEHLNLELYPL
jgi:predicted nucleic acid-binding protein